MAGPLILLIRKVKTCFSNNCINKTFGPVVGQVVDMRVLCYATIRHIQEKEIGDHVTKLKIS